MPLLSDRIETVLNEARMLLLGGQVLLGFSYRIVFEAKFERIPLLAQASLAVALAAMSAGLGWLIWPAAFHRIAEDGRQTARIHNLTNAVLDWALLPFAIGLGCTLYPVSVATRAPHPILIGILAILFATTAWYGSALFRRHSGKRSLVRERPRDEEEKQDSRKELGERIKTALMECRMALPGAQAFLGFQFAIVFAESFDRLPRALQWIHFGSLLSTTVATVLLIAPAAFHRLAEAGQETERFHRVASRLLLVALVFLAPGICGDLAVVLWKVSASTELAAVVAGAMLTAFLTLWFAVSAFSARKR